MKKLLFTLLACLLVMPAMAFYLEGKNSGPKSYFKCKEPREAYGIRSQSCISDFDAEVTVQINNNSAKVNEEYLRDYYNSRYKGEAKISATQSCLEMLEDDEDDKYMGYGGFFTVKSQEKGEERFAVVFPGGYVEMFSWDEEGQFEPDEDIRALCQYYESGLFDVVEDGNLAFVKVLLKQPDLDINQTEDPFDRNVLMEIASKDKEEITKDDIEIAKALLKRPDLDVNYVANYYHETALEMAAKNGHVEIVRELLKRKDLDFSVNDQGSGALEAAEDEGYSEIEVMLKDAGVTE